MPLNFAIVSSTRKPIIASGSDLIVGSYNHTANLAA